MEECHLMPMCTMYQMYEPVENMLLARDSYLPQYSLTLCNMEAEAKLVYNAVNSMLTPDIVSGRRAV